MLAVNVGHLFLLIGIHHRQLN